MKTRALLVASDERLADWLRAVVGNLLEIDGISTDDPNAVIAEFYRGAAPSLVFVEFAATGGAQRAALVERLAERLPQVPVAGVAARESSDLVLSAIRAGARDFFVMDRDDGAIATQVSRILQRQESVPATAEASTKKGRLITLLAASPGPELPFLGVHVALAFNERTKRARERVLLLDMTTTASAAAVFLNINQTYSVIDVMHDAHRCDETLIDTAFSKHSSGIYVLSLPEDTLGLPALDPVEVSRIVGILRTLFTFVVVTIDGFHPIESTASLLNMSDRTLVVCDQSVLKSRHTKHLVRSLRVEGCDLDRAGLVVDDYRRRLSLEPSSLAELLDLPLVCALQTDALDRILAMNSGESMFLTAKRDPYCAGVRKLAASLAFDAAPAPLESSRASLRAWLS